MTRGLQRCGCNICHFQNDPVSSRIVQLHESKYGSAQVNSSPISSPYKPNRNVDDLYEEERFSSSGLPISKSDLETDSEHENEDDNLGLSFLDHDMPSSEPQIDDESQVLDHDEYQHDSYSSGSDQDSNLDNSESENSSAESDEDCSDELWSMNYNKHLFSDGTVSSLQKIPNSDLTVLEWLAMNFLLFSSHPAFSKQTFTENLQMQKRIQNDSNNILPSNYYEARKVIAPYITKKIKYDVCVNDCVIYRSSNKFQYADLIKCPICGEDRYFPRNSSEEDSRRKRSKVARRTFLYIPVGPKLIQSHPGDSYEGAEMYDIHHSPAWKTLYGQNGYFGGNKMGISLAFELDEVNPYHNIGVMYSMTPIMLTLLNLPRNIRNAFANIFLVGIIPGRKVGQPKASCSSLDAYLEILVDELLYLSECKVYSEYHKGPINVKIKVLLYILDYPGLSKLFNQHGSGSLSGCHWCHIQGMKCRHLDKVIYLSNKSVSNTNRSTKKGSTGKQPRKRTLEEEKCYRQSYENAKNKTQANMVASATGCKGSYVLASLPGHNRLEESKPDACHTIKDVTQNIFNLLTGRNINLDKVIAKELSEERYHVIGDNRPTDESDHGPVQSKTRKCKSNEKVYPFMLTHEETERADRRALGIRPPCGFGLKPSAFFSKPGSLKSHDWKQIACQGILNFCIRDSLSDICRDTLFNFFECITALCQEKQDIDEIDKVEGELNKALCSLEDNFPLSLHNITICFNIYLKA